MTHLELATVLIRTKNIFEQEKIEANGNLEKAVFAGFEAFCNVLTTELLKIKDEKK